MIQQPVEKWRSSCRVCRGHLARASGGRPARGNRSNTCVPRGQDALATGGPDARVTSARDASNSGTVLIVTMWIVLVLAGLVLVLAQAMRVEAVCSANGVSILQADAIEQGAVQYVLSYLDNLQGLLPDETDMPCEAVRVGNGAFWIVKANSEDDRLCAYGVVDEASKLNLNTARLEMLLFLPDMTDDLAASIVDWRSSADSAPTPGGARSEYYMLLPDPYLCKSSTFETVGELFLVKGATNSILHGEDANRNFVLDPNEDDADASEPPDNRDGKLDRRLLPFLTVYSSEPNTAADGSARVNVNTTSGSSRTTTRGAAPPPQPSAQGNTLTDLLLKSMSTTRVSQVLDVVRLEQRIRPFANVLDFAVRARLTQAEFEAIADYVTTDTQTVLKGRINVNTAPREVLTCLAGLESSDVDALIAQRAQTDADTTNIAWVLQAIEPAKAQAIGGLITAMAYQFSADIVSVAGDGRAFRRCHVVIDALQSPPKVIYRQDLTDLGWPLAPEIIARLRAGASIDEFAPVQTFGKETSK